MSPPWRRLRAAWMTLTGTGAAASAAFGLLVFASVLASLAIPRDSTGLRTSALRHVVAASPADQAVLGSIGLTDASVAFSASQGENPAPGIAAVGARLRSLLAAAGLPVSSAQPAWSALTSGDEPVTGLAGAAGRQPQFAVTYRTALARYSQVVAGRLPSGAQGSTAQAAVTAATAARFGLRVGDHLDMGPAVRLVITGILRPVHPAADFWSENPGVSRPVLIGGTSAAAAHWTGTLFIGAGALPLVTTGLNANLMLLTWVVPADLGRLTADQAGPLRAGIDGLVSSGLVISSPAAPAPGSQAAGSGSATCPVRCPAATTTGPPPVTVAVNSQIPAILTPFIAADGAVAPLLGLLYVSLAVLGAVVVLLGARLVAQRRAAEFTLMRARGAALHQLGWLALRASVVIAVTAGALAALLAVLLTPGGGNRVSWWLAGVTIAVTLAAPTMFSVLPQRVAAPGTGRPGRRASGRTRAARRIVLEAVLVAAAIGGLVVLRKQGLSAGNAALYPSAAPVLLAVPVAVVVLRCYPPAARGLAQIAGRSRGVAAFVGLARATRTPPGAALPAFALVLALTMVAFPAMISASVTRGQVAQSWRQVGADAVIQAPSGAVLPPALQRQLAALPGVTATAAGEITAASLPATGQELTALFISPARYAAVTGQAPGARFPVAALSGPGTRGGGTVPAAANAAAAPLVGRAPAQLALDSTQTLTLRVTGLTGSVPGAGTDAVVVLPLSALGSPTPAPNYLLLDGPGLDGARLRADVSRALPGASVTLRATALASMTGAPVPHAAQVALAQGMAAAAGFGALVLLLSLVLGAPTRNMTLARLATMGLRRWQGQLMLVAETLPEVVAAALGGAACAWLLVPLIGPSVDLAAFTAAGPGVAVVSAPYPLAAAASGLVLAALFVLAAQAVVSYRRGSARALRIAE
jgi:putative ABC transport system permease protein